MAETAAARRQGAGAFRMMAQLANPGDQTKDPAQPWPADRKMVDLGTITVTRPYPTAPPPRRAAVPAEPPDHGIEVSDDPLITPASRPTWSRSDAAPVAPTATDGRDRRSHAHRRDAAQGSTCAACVGALRSGLADSRISLGNAASGPGAGPLSTRVGLVRLGLLGADLGQARGPCG